MATYGISSWVTLRIKPDDAIAMMTAAGFREVELSAAKSLVVQAWERDPEAIMSKLRDVSMNVRTIHCPDIGRSLDSLDPVARQASIDANVVYFDLARRSGAEAIVIHPTGKPIDSLDDTREARKARAVESLKVLADHAGLAGVGMAVENLPGKDGEKPGVEMGELREMIDGLGDHVGLCFDIGHTVMIGLDPVDEIKVAGDKLRALHLHDVNEQNRDHYIPGEGVLEWDSVFASLDEIGFDGVRTIEIKPPQSDVAERVLAIGAVREEWERQ